MFIYQIHEGLLYHHRKEKMRHSREDIMNVLTSSAGPLGAIYCRIRTLFANGSLATSHSLDVLMTEFRSLLQNFLRNEACREIPGFAMFLDVAVQKKLSSYDNWELVAEVNRVRWSEEKLYQGWLMKELERSANNVQKWRSEHNEMNTLDVRATLNAFAIILLAFEEQSRPGTIKDSMSSGYVYRHLARLDQEAARPSVSVDEVPEAVLEAEWAAGNVHRPDFGRDGKTKLGSSPLGVTSAIKLFI